MCGMGIYNIRLQDCQENVIQLQENQMNKKKNPKMSQFNVRVTADELENLRRKAWDQSTSVSNLVRLAMADRKLLESRRQK